ncbi:hypothetical protein Agub_g7879 [Astrephomene gubernaculifera]|uniref:Uncharacterized protein n=1 Tax=Astrephomene gubernaculifera TaxID=47775 RepID=A0AAD3DSF0_9CHLO|nr:hypothetical protein Agub_g7879 [Astrephomene gubernaculifera]
MSGKLFAPRSVRPCPATRTQATHSNHAGYIVIDMARKCAVSTILSACLLSGPLVEPSPSLAMGQTQPATRQLVLPPLSSSSAPSSSLLLATTTTTTFPPLATMGPTAAATAAAPTTTGAAPPASAPAPAPAALSTVTAADVAIEAVEEAVMEMQQAASGALHFFERGFHAVESSVHHLQLLHALERLQDMPLGEVVDLGQLKAALHPPAAPAAAPAAAAPAAAAPAAAAPAAAAPAGDSPDAGPAPTAAGGSDEQQQQQPQEEPASNPELQQQQQRVAAAVAEVHAALEGVAGWRLGQVVDVGRLADALQDVPPPSDPLAPRALLRVAPAIRHRVHWGQLAGAVKHQALRQALLDLAASSGEEDSPFAGLDVRAAVSAVRMDVVRQVLRPPSAPVSYGDGDERRGGPKSLEGSGLWTWEV